MRQNTYPGTYIVIEGPDGAGTTTNAKRLVEELSSRFEDDETDVHYVFEPSDNKIGTKIDEMIRADHSPESVALAFAADRRVHLDEKVVPLLKEGDIVVSDRAYHSSLVYQPEEGVEYEWVKEINREALRPDRTFILTVDSETGMSRVDGRGEEKARFENEQFQAGVVERYRKLNEDLDEDIEYVNALQTPEEVFTDVLARLLDSKFV